LFTFLSGYVYAMRPLRGGYPQFVRGKARRLLIPLLFVGTLFIIIQGFAPGTNSSITDETPWYLWHIIPIRHLWFLESIFWVFLLVGILDRFKRLNRLTTILAIVVVAVVVDALVPEGNNLLGIRMALYLLPFFLAGLACQRFDWRSAPVQWKVLIVVATVALTVVTQLGVWGVTEEVPSRHSPIAAALGICACLMLLLTRWTARPLVYIGAFSFVIYLVHPIGAAGTRYVLDRFGIESTSVNMIIGILGGLAFGIVIELGARRFRITRLLVLGEKYRRKTPQVAAPEAAGTPLGTGPQSIDAVGSAQPDEQSAGPGPAEPTAAPHQAGLEVPR
jgi:peptidoglycan/LPS O-acetylase OafA/YrhL